MCARSSISCRSPRCRAPALRQRADQRARPGRAARRPAADVRHGAEAADHRHPHRRDRGRNRRRSRHRRHPRRQGLRGHRARRRALEETPRIGMRWRPGFIRCIGKRNGAFIAVLDIGRIFSRLVGHARSDPASRPPSRPSGTPAGGPPSNPPSVLEANSESHAVHHQDEARARLRRRHRAVGGRPACWPSTTSAALERQHQRAGRWSGGNGCGWRSSSQTDSASLARAEKNMLLADSASNGAQYDAEIVTAATGSAQPAASTCGRSRWTAAGTSSTSSGQRGSVYCRTRPDPGPGQAERAEPGRGAVGEATASSGLERIARFADSRCRPRPQPRRHLAEQTRELPRRPPAITEDGAARCNASKRTSSSAPTMPG